MDGVEWKSRMADVRERAETAQFDAQDKILSGDSGSLLERIRWAAPHLKDLGSCALEIVRLIPHIPEAAVSEMRRKRDFQ